MSDTLWNIPKELLNKHPYFDTRYGLEVTEIQSGRTISAYRDETFPQASAIKIPIVWELFHQATNGDISLDEKIAAEPENGAGGCGILQHFKEGESKLSLNDLAMLMIKLSDNVATNMLIDFIGIERINQRLEGLGLNQTRLRRKMMDFEARDRGEENTSTPKEANQLLQNLLDESKSTDQISRNSANQTIELLAITKESPLQEAIPSGFQIINKPGMLPGLRTEWIIVKDSSGTPLYTASIMIERCDESISDNQLKTMIGCLAGQLHRDIIG